MIFKSIFSRVFRSETLAVSMREDRAAKAQTGKSAGVNKQELTVLFRDVLNDESGRSDSGRGPIA